MFRILLVLLLLLSPLTWAETVPSLDSLSELNWKNRLILINAGNDVSSYQDELSQMDTEIIERDVVWFIVSPTAVISNFDGKLTAPLANEIRQKLQYNHSSVLLIGKDGGVKATEPQLILNELFAEIDSMPMRQREM